MIILKFSLIFLCFFGPRLFAQDSGFLAETTKIIVHKDPRLDILGEKEADINAAYARLLARTSMGFRLQVLSTNDRELAMKTKSQLLQKFPDQKVYMLFQLPYLKLRFGNFKTRQEAETYRNQISKMLGGASVYCISERIEVKPEKEEDTN